MKNVFVFLFSVCVAIACASFQIPKDATPDFASSAACYVLTNDECFGPALDMVGIHKGTCQNDINAATSGVINLDFSNSEDLPRKCKSELYEIQNYIKNFKVPK